MAGQSGRIIFMRLTKDKRQKTKDKRKKTKDKRQKTKYKRRKIYLKHFHGGAVWKDYFHEVDKECDVCFIEGRNLFVIKLFLCLRIPKAVPCVFEYE